MTRLELMPTWRCLSLTALTIAKGERTHLTFQNSFLMVFWFALPVWLANGAALGLATGFAMANDATTFSGNNTSKLSKL